LNGKEALLRELEGLSDLELQEAIDFVHFLRQKATQEARAPASLSESVLERDWLRPEEDEAWRAL
jgi:hypothetical protein